MASANTTRSSLDNVLLQDFGEIQYAWKMPKRFNQLNGKVMIERVEPQMTSAGQRKWFEWPIEYSADWGVAAGGGFTASETEDSIHAKLYPKIITATAEIDPVLEYTESGYKKAIKEAEKKRNGIVNHQLPALGMHHWWGDGSGRRARIYSVIDDSGTGGSKVVLKPLFARDAAPGCMDATKYLLQNMKVLRTTADETGDSGAGTFAAVASTEYKIVTLHKGTTIYSGSDPAYIIVTPRIGSHPTADTGTYVTQFISITHPLSGNALNGEPQGCNAWIGDGYNARTDANTSGVNAAYPAFGLQKYANVDRQNANYPWFKGHVYNRNQTTPLSAVTLTSTVWDNWMADFYSAAPDGTDVSVFVANSYLRARFNTAFAAQGTLYLDNRPIREIGWEGASVFDPYAKGGQGQWKPIHFVDDAPRESIWGFSWKFDTGNSVFYQAVCKEFHFFPSPTGLWWDMRPITGERIMRARGEQEAFLINLHPAASTAMFFVSE